MNEPPVAARKLRAQSNPTMQDIASWDLLDNRHRWTVPDCCDNPDAHTDQQ